jgi:aerobic-type carbon monoxide dehydrogenase small subunit (CoxS/CutS family)
MDLTVNGTRHDVLSPPLTTLLDVLREELRITSRRRDACRRLRRLHGARRGEPRRSCLTPLAAVEGRSISTVEGARDARRPRDGAGRLHEHYAAQCGF